MSIKAQLDRFHTLLPQGVELVAVSKTFPQEAILEAYEAGQRIFGESRVQELTAKYEALPKNIEWHMVGHLQRNKVKHIAPFVTLIHSVDSSRLIEEIDKEAQKNNRMIDILLEIHLAREPSKEGWVQQELMHYLDSGQYRQLKGVRFRGVMGMATYTEDEQLVRSEFHHLGQLFSSLKERYFGPEFDILSMGMSGDYELAVECGSKMVRIGSLIFGGR